MFKAGYFKELSGNKVKCLLCPHECIINEGKTGLCSVRKNIGGTLISLVYGKPVAIHIDPIEKKPLYHFYPGQKILSFGTVGCNLKCFFCQNCEISQATPDENLEMERTPEEIIQLAGLNSENIGIAYTYNEPVIFFEYMLDIAKIAAKKGLKNVVVSNGYINKEPLSELINFTDAFNIDLKAFSEKFYSSYTHSKLQPVLDSIKIIKKSGKHLELTHLIIPGLNDDLIEFREMIKWIKNETGEKTVLHLSRYFPHFRSKLPPTPSDTLINMYNIAKEELNYTYLGNYQSSSGNDTLCPTCNNTVIKRSNYQISLSGLDKYGYCIYCGELVIKNI